VIPTWRRDANVHRHNGKIRRLPVERGVVFFVGIDLLRKNTIVSKVPIRTKRLDCVYGKLCFLAGDTFISTIDGGLSVPDWGATKAALFIISLVCNPTS
jgi:hypothetical protein